MTQWPNGSKTQQPAISSPFGPRTGGAFSFHYGADMVGFSEIRAVDGGLVTFSGWLNDAAGWTVAVDIGGGVTHVYMHNAVNHVARGFRVEEGQLLATMGRSGNATGNCLHFEVREHGTSIEPLQWVRNRLPRPAPAGGSTTAAPASPADLTKLLEEAMSNPIINVVKKYGDPKDSGTLWIGADNGEFVQYVKPFDPNVRGVVSVAFFGGGGSDDLAPSLNSRDFQTVRRIWKTMKTGKG